MDNAKRSERNRQFSGQFLPAGGPGFSPGRPPFEPENGIHRSRRATLCPGELQRDQEQAARFSEEVSSFEREKVFSEENFCSSRVSMCGKPRGPYRPLARSRVHRFVSKVSDELRFRDVLLRSTVFSAYAADERRSFLEEKKLFEDRASNGIGWLSLDGRLMNAESATSVNRIGGNLGYEEAAAWEGFSPLQRVLIVAVAAAAAANSKQSSEIKQLERSVGDRDQALAVMRRKLNDLWERIFSLQDRSGTIDQSRKIADGIVEYEDDGNAAVQNAGNCDLWERVEEDSSRNWMRKTGSAESIPLDSTHARCAAAILELKRRTEQMIEKEASNVMAAFASVLEKVENLESYGSSPVHEGRNDKAQGTTLGDLKVSVEQASAQITSLQMSLFDIWHALLPEALCAINISPSELDHYLDKAKKESSMVFPSKQFSTQAWKQWLNMQEHASEANFLPILQDEPEEDGLYRMPLTVAEQEERRLSDLSDWSSTVTSLSDHNIWHSVEADVASAIGVAVRRTVDKIIAPLDVQKPTFKNCSQETVAEKLLGDLETAATKVAEMESQLRSLKEYLKTCEMKRNEAETKLAEALRQNIRNQAEANMEIVELVGQLQLEDHAYADLIHSRKAQLNLAAKEEQIACLQEDCKQKDDTIKEITLAAQISKDASDKRLAVLEDICKRKNATIMRLKEEMVVLEEKVSELMRFQTPSSSNWTNASSLPPVMSTNLLFDMEDIPSSPDSESSGKLHGSQDQSLTPCGDQDLVADEYASSSYRSFNGFEQRTLVQSSASSPASARFRRESAESSTSGYHSIFVGSGQSTWTKDRLCKSSTSTRYINENTKSVSLSPQKIKSSRSGNVLSGVDINSTLKSKRLTSESEGGRQSTRNNQSYKSKDIEKRKRWM